MNATTEKLIKLLQPALKELEAGSGIPFEGAPAFMDRMKQQLITGRQDQENLLP